MELDNSENSRGNLRMFINGGHLQTVLRTNNLSSFSILKYVSYVNRTLRLLVCGDCPGCSSRVVRNICNVHFCNTVLTVMLPRFPRLLHVKPVLTHENDIAQVVNSYDLQITHPIVRDEPKSAYAVMKVMLDFNPNIDGHMKMLSKRGEHHPTIPMNSTTTWDEMIDRYNAVWMVNEECFKILDVDGNLAAGHDALAANFTLPQFLVEVSDDGAPTPLVMSYNPQFFDPGCYIWIE